MDRRTFLAAAGGGLAFASLSRAGVLAPRVMTADTLRQSPGRVRISWTPTGAKADIFVSSDPADELAAMNCLATEASDATEVAAPLVPRPYFVVRTDDGRQTRTAERPLPLEGGRNFRDLGGYLGFSGKQVRWGRIYRSGAMTGLTVQDMGYLGRLGLRVVCDLRSVEERQRAPSPFLHVPDGEVAVFDYTNQSTSMGAMTSARTREEAIDAFANAYVGFTEMLAPNYTDLFKRLLAAQAPLAINCSAGKDRTGMASALILSLLGVARETVVADYALTETYSPPGAYPSITDNGGPSALGLSPQVAQALHGMPPEVVAIVRGAHPDVMRRTLARVDQVYGSPAGLAKVRFGLADRDIARIRELYLI